MKIPKTEKVKVSEIKLNDNNPRIIKDEKFKKLVKSIQDFPEMLQLRPIVVDDENIILGGNMRFRACVEAGLSEVYILRAENLSEEQKKEFIIKDNVGFGEWDWDVLANEWNNEQLESWGLNVWKGTETDLDKFFEETDGNDDNNKFKIVLEYTEEEFTLVNEKISSYGQSKEQVIFKLLGL